jgi:predicted nucleic acid-binding protein
VLKRKSTKAKKNPSAFFGKLKDGTDGLSYQKSSAMSGANYLVDTNFLIHLLNGNAAVKPYLNNNFFL